MTTPATLTRTEVKIGTSGPTDTFIATFWGRAVLRTEQRECLERNRGVNKATVKQDETNPECQKHSPRNRTKGRYAYRLFGTNFKERSM